MKLKLFILLFMVSISTSVSAQKSYKASLFGIKSNGVVNNTGSIQKAIDYISDQGGGTLVFYVGRYLTGTIELKSDVHIRLEEGAVLVGSTTPYAYSDTLDVNGIIVAEGQENIGIAGKGVIEGRGSSLRENTADQLNKGYIKEDPKPGLIAFSHCTDVNIDSIHLWYGGYKAITLKGCEKVKMEGLSIEGKKIPSSQGIFLSDCHQVKIDRIYVAVEGHPIVAKNNQWFNVYNSKTNTGKPLHEFL